MIKYAELMSPGHTKGRTTGLWENNILYFKEEKLIWYT